MDIEIEEMSASLTVVEMKALKAEVIAAVLDYLAETKRLDAKRDAERKVVSGARRMQGG
jgi:SOS response regulatory protein OraA/RecX